MIKENEKSKGNTINSIFSKLGIKYIPFVGIIDKDYYGNPDNDGHIMFAFYNIKDVNTKVCIKKGFMNRIH